VTTKLPWSATISRNFTADRAGAPSLIPLAGSGAALIVVKERPECLPKTRNKENRDEPNEERFEHDMLPSIEADSTTLSTPAL
jgi:hypothetical protein